MTGPENEPEPELIDRHAIESVKRGGSPVSFDPARGVSYQELEEVLRLAAMAPSRYNLQPWRFLVVRTPANRQRLRRCVPAFPGLALAPAVVVVLAYRYPDRSHLEEIARQAKAAGLLSEETALELKARARASLERADRRGNWCQQTGMLAAAYFMIGAESRGLATVFCDEFEEEELRRRFGIPDDHVVCCLVGVGHASSESTLPGRLGPGELCYREHFGQPWSAS